MFVKSCVAVWELGLLHTQQLMPLHPKKPEQTCHPVTSDENCKRDASSRQEKIPLLILKKGERWGITPLCKKMITNEKEMLKVHIPFNYTLYKHLYLIPYI